MYHIRYRNNFINTSFKEEKVNLSSLIHFKQLSYFSNILFHRKLYEFVTLTLLSKTKF